LLDVLLEAIGDVSEQVPLLRKSIPGNWAYDFGAWPEVRRDIEEALLAVDLLLRPQHALTNLARNYLASRPLLPISGSRDAPYDPQGRTIRWRDGVLARSADPHDPCVIQAHGLEIRFPARFRRLAQDPMEHCSVQLNRYAVEEGDDDALRRIIGSMLAHGLIIEDGADTQED